MSTSKRKTKPKIQKKTSPATRILEAGGIVPNKGKSPKDVPVDELQARAYPHPALGRRLVVRLAAGALVPAVDLEMDALGFERVEERGVVGRRMRRILGFPGWALVNDPKHARYALEVLKTFKKEARRARTKPGYAKDGVDTIGATLGRSVPHFLPSFYEEAGRAFLEAGSAMYAAQFFEKAREAERVHALKVDEDLRRDAFLEFALAGAVSIKSLSAYARELQKSQSPEAAYDHFRQLCVRRTLGGLPPWAGMAKELRRLAKAAGRKVADDERALLAEIIESPSLAKAPEGFFSTYRKALLELAKKSAAVRGALLNLMPTAETEGFDAWWLELLQEAGALDALTAEDGDSVDAEARPTGGAAAWLEKLCKHVRRHWHDFAPPPMLFDLVERMAPRLNKDGAPLVFGERWHTVDLDLSDYALELGIALKDPKRNQQFDLEEWAKEAEQPGRGRDPVNMAKDKRYGKMLEQAVANAAGGEPFETVARGKKGLAKARRSWLLGLVRVMGDHALPGIEQSLETLGESTSVHTFAEFPEAYEALQKVDLAPALRRTLQAAVFDELGWDVLDEAAGELLQDAKLNLRIGGTWPYLILTNNIKVIVVSPTERVLEHDFRKPKKADLEDLRYVDGQLLVIYKSDNGSKGYWSDKPSKKLNIEGPSWYSLHVGESAWQLPEGGVSEGGAALNVGDTKVTGREKMLCDGETCWKLEWRSDRQQLREFDPRTGQRGRFSAPAWLEAFVKGGQRLWYQSCELLPLPSGVDWSPLGIADGRVGWRVRLSGGGIEEAENDWDTAGATAEFEAPDGRRWSGELPDENGWPSGLLKLPGDDEPRAVGGTGWSRWSSSCAYDLYAPGGDYKVATLESGDPDYHRGTSVVPPLSYWHFLRYRDEAGSKSLRAISAKATQALFNAACAEWEKADQKKRRKLALPKTEAALKKQLKKLSHQRLRTGVLGLLATAARCRGQLAELVKERNPENAEALADVGDLPDDEAAREALGWLIGSSRGDGAFGSHVRAVAALAEGKQVKLPESSLDWWGLLGHLGEVAFLSVAFGTSDEHRKTLQGVLRTFLDTPFVDAVDRMRVLRVKLKDEQLPFPVDADHWNRLCETWKGNFYFIARDGRYWSNNHHWVVEYAPKGKFRDLPKAKVAQVRKLAGNLRDSAFLRNLLAEAESRGKLAWDPAVPAQLAARTGLSAAEATLVWAGLPNLDSYDHHFLPKQLREELGLKAAEANTARAALKELDRDKLYAVFESIVPAELATMWAPLGENAADPDSLVNRFADAWIERFGKRVSVPPEMAQDIEKELKPDVRPATVCGWLADPKGAPELTQDAKWVLSPDDGIVGTSKGGKHFTEEVLVACATYLPYMATTLPVGAPFRDKLPELLEAVRARLKNPDLLCTGVGWEDHDYEEKKSKKFIESLPGKPYVSAGKKTAGKRPSKDTGVIVALLSEYAGVDMVFRPAKVQDWDSLAEFASPGWGDCVSPLIAAMLVGSDGYTAHAARIRNTPVPEGGYEANPLLSVPELVADVQQKLALSEDAAVLYLQTLALAYPAKKLVQLFNGWKPARYTKAAKELLARELVVQAKRSRAARAHFLPGGWEALSAPLKPIESWKLSLYDLSRDEGGVVVPLGRILPSEPVHQLFAKAWQRVCDGDAPAYEEVK